MDKMLAAKRIASPHLISRGKGQNSINDDIRPFSYIGTVILPMALGG
jgi:hypothetical protein